MFRSLFTCLTIHLRQALSCLCTSYLLCNVSNKLHQCVRSNFFLKSNKNLYSLQHFRLAASFIHRHTPLPPSSPYICRSSWPLQEEGGGRERTRGNKKRKRGGKGVSVYKVYPPPSPSLVYPDCKTPIQSSTTQMSLKKKNYFL